MHQRSGSRFYEGLLTTTLSSFASVWTGGATRMGSIRGCVRVGLNDANRISSVVELRPILETNLPDIHFITAGSVFSATSVGIVRRRSPAVDVALTN